MFKKKQVMATMLVGVMMASALSGCSGSGGTSTTAAASATTAATASASANEATTEVTSTEASDAADWGLMNGQPISAEPITIKVFAKKSTTIADYATMEYLQKHAEVNNMTIEWECVNTEMLDERLNVIIASGDLPDMFLGLSSDQFEVLKQAGAVADISEYLDDCPSLNAFVAEHPETKQYYTDPDGSVWIMPFFDGLTTNYPLVCRQDWLDALGMDTPITKEDWLAYWVAVRDNDMNGNGDPSDEIPFSAAEFQYLIRLVSAFEMYDGFFVDAQNGDQVVYSYTDPRYKEFLEWMSMLWSENLIDRNIFTNDSATLQNNHALNLVGSYSGLFNGQFNSYLTSFQSKIEGYDLVGAEPMMSDNGLQLHPYSDPLVKVSGTSGTIVSITSKYPKECVQFCDWFYDWTAPTGGGFRNIFGYEGLSFEFTNDEKTEYNYTDLVLDNPDGLSAAQYLGTITTRGQYAGYVNEIGSFKMWKPQVEAGFDALNKFYDVSLPYMLPPLTFSTEQDKKIRSTMADIDTFVEESVSGFITGTKSIDEFDSFVATVEKMGIQEIVDIYNESYTTWKQPRD